MPRVLELHDAVMQRRKASADFAEHALMEPVDLAIVAEERGGRHLLGARRPRAHVRQQIRHLPNDRCRADAPAHTKPGCGERF